MSSWIGKRIKHARIRRGLTQTALGLAVGFPADQAGIRIAQYESGFRTPKEPLLYSIAKVLDVSIDYLAFPSFETDDDIIRFLLDLDDQITSISYYASPDATKKTMAVTFFSTSVNDFLCQLQKHRKQLQHGTITEDEYGVFSHTDLRSLHRCCTASHFPE